MHRATDVRPIHRSGAISSVRNKETGPSPEEPDQSLGSLRIVVSSLHFEWLTTQCSFLGITKQQLVADALEEWICRNETMKLPVDPSDMVQRALNEFIYRHRDEFLSPPGEG